MPLVLGIQVVPLSDEVIKVPVRPPATNTPLLKCTALSVTVTPEVTLSHEEEFAVAVVMSEKL